MIYHITTKAEWLVAKTAGVYEPESLEQQGFIHCCTEDKFEQILNFYFSGRTGLVALEIDPNRLRAEVKFEGEENNVHPHIYGPLHIDAVLQEADLIPNDEGVMLFPFRPVLH